MCKEFVPQYSLWSHKSITVDSDPQLSGVPDYMIAQRSKLGKNVLGLRLDLSGFKTPTAKQRILAVFPVYSR